MVPLAYTAVQPGAGVQMLVQMLGAVLLITALLVRSQYPRAELPRLVAGVGGALLVLAWLLPLIRGAGLGAGLGAVIAVIPLLVCVAGVLAAFLSGGSIAKLALTLAWVLITWPFVGALLTLAVTPAGFAQVRASLVTSLYIPVAITAWTAMVAYGAASAVGKKLERRENS